MPLYILKQSNWVDVFVLIILFRICYIAVINGLAVELFKLLGTLLAVYVSLHYYTPLADLIGNRLNLKSTPKELLSFLIFIIFAISGYFVFVILRKIFSRLIILEPLANLNKWGGFFLGIVRFTLCISLIMYLFIIAPSSYLRHSFYNSFSGRYLVRVAPGTYSSLWKGIISKFMTHEKFNQDVLRVQDTQEIKK